jgi:hypothetical protein
MNITISSEPVAKAILKLNFFKSQMHEYLDLESSVMSCLIITDNPQKIELHKLFRLFYMCTDWGNFLSMLHFTEVEDIDFTMYSCDVTRMVVYDPKNLGLNLTEDTLSGQFYFQNKELSKTLFLVTNSLNAKIEKHIEFMLSTELIDYVNKKWVN